MFQLSDEEFVRLRSQTGLSNPSRGGAWDRPIFVQAWRGDAVACALEAPCSAGDHRNYAGLRAAPPAARVP
jgi:hypothetical protein